MSEKLSQSRNSQEEEEYLINLQAWKWKRSIIPKRQSTLTGLLYGEDSSSLIFLALKGA
jgi:hypothetical protein